MENKTYFHITTQHEIDELRMGKLTWDMLNDKYQQPNWCSMHNALSPCGCWSLTMPLYEENEKHVDINFCKGCEFFVE